MCVNSYLRLRSSLFIADFFSYFLQVGINGYVYTMQLVCYQLATSNRLELVCMSLTIRDVTNGLATMSASTSSPFTGLVAASEVLQQRTSPVKPYYHYIVGHLTRGLVFQFHLLRDTDCGVEA